MSGLLEDIVRQYLAAKIQKEHIVNYSGSNLAYTHAADMANKLKLNENQSAKITPYPAQQSVTIISPAETSPQAETPEQQPTPQPTVTTRRETPPWAWALIGSLVGTAATGGAMWLASGDKTPAALEKGTVGLQVEGWK